MKVCPQCHAQLDDNAAFCTACGFSFAANQQQSQANPGFNTQPHFAAQPNFSPVYDPYDHTAEFDPKDISDNKVIAMLVYLLGAVGVIIALLASSTSPYLAFHVRQALKFTVIEFLLGICTILLIWTVIVPLAAVIAFLVLWVVKIICFFQICSGKAKEPAIIRSFGFLK